MLAEIFPRAHVRYSSLPVLGPYLDGFVVWLCSQGYPRLPICLRVRASKTLDTLLWRDGVARLEELSAEELLAYAPASSQDDIYRAALVRSLVRYLEAECALAPSPSTRSSELTASYCSHLHSTRGLAVSTVNHHGATVREFLAYLGKRTAGAQLDARLRTLDIGAIEGFIEVVAKRLSRHSLQHTVAHLRSFLRFLTVCGLVPPGLDDGIDTPRVYRDECLPRALPWDTVLSFLRSIDRSTPMGRRDYAMFQLVVTYGLRTCEVVSLRLDDIAWREGRLQIARSKIRKPLMLPLTKEVGAAILAYLQDGRPALAHREIFLRTRAPAGTLKPTAVTEAFQGWVRRSDLPIPFQGPHCLRHSDYDPTARTLQIQATKFHKSCLVPLSCDATREMDDYLRVRRNLPHGADGPLLCNWSRGLRSYTGAGLAQGLRQLFQRAEIRTASGRLPRIHDLRHAFAHQALLRWYRAGVDVHTKLPALATYMGHVSIVSTQHYLALLKPFAQEASERFDRHCQLFLEPASGDLGP